MPQAKHPQRQRRPGRGQAPPPGLRAQGRTYDGFGVVQEWEDPAALLPWQVLRDVLLWARRAEAPGPLFRASAMCRRLEALTQPTIPSDLRAPLTVLSGVLAPVPAEAPEELARACRAVSRWAEENGLPQTAIAFAQGAALLHPTDPGHAYHIGLLCRRAAEYPRAETWYRRALRLAKLAGDNQTAALCWSGLGNLLIQHGSYDAAKLAHRRAFSIARRQGFWNIKGNALHDLFTIAVDEGQVVEAENLARKAFQAYPRAADRMPALASDVASHWMHQGFYERAIIVYQAILPTLRLVSERLLIISVIARAAAGSRDTLLFTWAWTEAWAILEREPTTARACAALYNLAYASACLGDWERALLAGRQSAELAASKGEKDVHARTLKLMDAVQHRLFEHLLNPRPEEPGILKRAETLARRIVRRLAAQ